MSSQVSPLLFRPSVLCIQFLMQPLPGTSEWILAKVISHDAQTGMYKLSDEDTESNKSKCFGSYVCDGIVSIIVNWHCHYHCKHCKFVPNL